MGNVAFPASGELLDPGLASAAEELPGEEESEESVPAESGFSRSSFPAPWSLFRFSGAVFSVQTPGFFILFYFFFP